MGIYEFAGCVVSYEPLYGLLRRRMETYRSDTEGQPDICRITIHVLQLNN